jgi:RNA recognition motif-containing protein
MKGFAHIDFESADSITKAVVKNGVELDGRALKVDASTAKSGGAGGRGGFGGGRGGRGGGDPMQRAQKSGAMIDNGGRNVTTFDD